MNRIKKKIINFDFLVVISLICFFTLINSIRVYNKLNDLEINTTNIIFMILTTILFTLVYYFKYKKNKFFLM
jgi:amino acid transporter